PCFSRLVRKLRLSISSFKFRLGVLGPTTAPGCQERSYRTALWNASPRNAPAPQREGSCGAEAIDPLEIAKALWDKPTHLAMTHSLRSVRSMAVVIQPALKSANRSQSPDRIYHDLALANRIAAQHGAREDYVAFEIAVTIDFGANSAV